LNRKLSKTEQEVLSKELTLSGICLPDDGDISGLDPLKVSFLMWRAEQLKKRAFLEEPS